MYRHTNKKRSRGGIRKIFTGRGFTVVMVLGIAVMLLSLGKEVVRKFQIQSQIKELEQEISTLEQQNSEFNELLAYFNSSAFQEKEARVKLNLTAPGETVVVLPEEENVTEEDEETVAVAEAAPTSNVQKWINYFFE